MMHRSNLRRAMRQTKTIGTLAAAVLPFIGHLFVPVAISAESKSLWVDAPSEALKASEPNIVYVDGQPLPVSLDNHHSFSIWIPVRNTGSSTGRAEFCILLQSERKQDCARDVNIVGPKNELVGGQVTTLSIRMSGVEAPISGYLGLLTYDLAGKPVAVSFRQLKVNAPLFPIIDWY